MIIAAKIVYFLSTPPQNRLFPVQFSPGYSAAHEAGGCDPHQDWCGIGTGVIATAISDAPSGMTQVCERPFPRIHEATLEARFEFPHKHHFHDSQSQVHGREEF
jgi:hypothetical protein